MSVVATDSAGTGEAASAVRRMPVAIHGCRPTSATIQPGEDRDEAERPASATTRRRKSRASSSRPRHHSHAPQRASAIMTTPMPTMTRKPKKGPHTGGRSSARKILEAGEAAVERVGDEQARAVGDGDLVAVASRPPRRERRRAPAAPGSRPVPMGLDRGDLGAAGSFAASSPAESPMKSWSGASTTAMPSPIFSMVRPWSACVPARR